MRTVDQYELKKSNTGFEYFYEAVLQPKEILRVQRPPVSANRRGINDIGYAYTGDVKVSATLTGLPDDENAVWQDIQPFDEINKTVSWIKFENLSETESAVVNLKFIMF